MKVWTKITLYNLAHRVHYIIIEHKYINIISKQYKTTPLNRRNRKEQNVSTVMDNYLLQTELI